MLSKFSSSAFALAGLAIFAVPARAAVPHVDPVGSESMGADMLAAAHALSFLESLPRNGPIEIGIVYPAKNDAERIEALEAGASLSRIPGPNQTVFRPIAVSVPELMKSSDPLTAVFILPGLHAEARDISDAVKRRRLVSISDDSECLRDETCVLMVRARRQVEIVLNTALADMVGARFSTVFTMMVKRK